MAHRTTVCRARREYTAVPAHRRRWSTMQGWLSRSLPTRAGAHPYKQVQVVCKLLGQQSSATSKLQHRCTRRQQAAPQQRLRGGGGGGRGGGAAGKHRQPHRRAGSPAEPNISRLTSAAAVVRRWNSGLASQLSALASNTPSCASDIVKILYERTSKGHTAQQVLLACAAAAPLGALWRRRRQCVATVAAQLRTRHVI